MSMIRIVSDGTSIGTRVLLPDGTPIEGIRSIEWEIEAGGMATATLVVEATADFQVAKVKLQRMRDERMNRLETRPEWPSIAQAIRDGWSLREAAEVFVCSPYAIRRALARTGEPPAHGRSGRRQRRGEWEGL